MSGREGNNGGDLSQEPALSPSASSGSEKEKREHSVWEEPHLAPLPLGTQTPYAKAYSAKIRSTTSLSSWGATLGAALIGGPFAILGALLYGFGPLGPYVWGPTAEEVLKIGAIAIVVETRPFLIRHGYQIVLAAAVSALAFAVIENLRNSRVNLTRPQFTQALGYLVAAIVLHGGYNVAVTIWEKGWSPVHFLR
ncbi:hypothetical protein ACFL3X_01450 [Gemmatimonadota bacterium]